MSNTGRAAEGKVYTAKGSLLPPSFQDIGTNSGLTTNGVLIANGNSPFTATAAGTNGQVLMGNTGADPSFQTGGTTLANTITGDSGGALSPSAGNWNIVGQQAGSIAVMDTIGSGSTMSIEDRTSPSKFVVDSSTTAGLRGTYSTIQSAITAASAGDTIIVRPGTYTENITLKSEVNISGFCCRGGSGSRTKIVGKLIDNGSAVGCTLTNIDFETNSDNIFALTASGSYVLCCNCRLGCANNTGISVSAGATVELWCCTGDLGTTGIGYSTGAGTVIYNYCALSNSGSSLTATTTSGGISFNYSTASNAFSTSGAGNISFVDAFVDLSGLNITAVTTAGTGTSNKVYQSTFLTGTASAISVGSGTILKFYDSVVNSSNANAITGAGEIDYGAVTFSGTSSTINTTTKVPVAWPVLQGGTGLTSTTINEILYSSAANTVSGLATANSGVLVTSATGVPSINATVSSWTPVIAFGGASVGITYNAQSGGYYQVGKIVFFDCYVDLSNKGSSTGAATITGLPALSPARTSICVISANALTFTGQITARIPNGTSSISIDSFATGGARAVLTDTAFANNTFLQISGQILLS